MRALFVSAWVALCLSGGVTQAGDGGPADHWRALTRTDVEAAFALLRDNHPGATREVGDRIFTAALAAGHAKALARAAAVTNYEGYVATLGEFAGAMGDGHVASGPKFLPRSVSWAGLIAAKHGANWVVANDDPEVAGGEFTGARIVECDGQSADARAREALAFRTDVSVDAMQVVRGAWLLIDEGNPFLARPQACVLEQGGQRISLTLRWSEIDRSKLLSQWWKRSYGAAGFGVRRSGAGVWIAIQELDPRAQAVIDAVKSQEAAVRAAPWVVVDLRGNDGGNDAYAYALAQEIYGPGRVAQVLGPSADGSGCTSVFRASPGNIEALDKSIVAFQKSGDAEGAREYTQAVQAMKAAMAAGRALTGDPTCPARGAPPALRPAASSMMAGKVFVLTDAVCFSSCLQAVDFLRKLGAVQVGQPTGGDTHYSEYRQVTLPSGLSTFSTLVAMMPDAPQKLGPYAPQYEYDGDISDTAALEKWISDTMMKAREPRTAQRYF
ncbi:S41 family peptidase [Dokdonella soli]|uniref:S41 family peptidase n=1 Tax=Dokdonella soli TaxID=529810 RepID=A0ABN1IPU1_9GAMM